jgi:hypothetical protein
METGKQISKDKIKENEELKEVKEEKDKLKENKEEKDKLKENKEEKDKVKEDKDKIKELKEAKDRKYIVASRLKLLCDKCSISNHTLGMYIRAWHIMTPAYMIILMFYISKLLYRALILYLLFLLIAFNYFKGCVLTVLEKQLCGDTFTFIDPLLEYNNIELNSKNRYSMSLIAAKLYLTITFTIYYYRFYRCKT